MNSETKSCQNCKKDFVIEPDDFQFYEKIKVPPPTWCPQCRMIRRMAFRNERSLYSRNCGLCGKATISMFSPHGPFTSYCHDCFHSDKWDPMSFGRDFDSSKPFFEQWYEMQKSMPQLGLLQENSVNSPWINYELDDKNCYLNVGGHQNEDSAYNQYAHRAKNTFDSFWPMDAQFVYETVLSENCYKTFYSTLVYECRDTYFSFDCRNCSNVIGCTGFRNKNYHIFNQPVDKEEFERFLQENLSSETKVKELQKSAKAFWRSQPQRAVFVDKSIRATGNLLKECKNCISCWMTEKTEDSKWQIFSLDTRDSYDIFSVWKGERCYDMLAGFKDDSVKFSTGVIESSNIEYSSFMRNCQNCFGCTNLHNKQYCILNKQYSKEEYYERVKEIRKHMSATPYVDRKGRAFAYGEFFPPELSSFGYSETVAYEYFPKITEDVEAQGFNAAKHGSETKIPASDYAIPDEISKVGDDILEKVLGDSQTKKSYRLIPRELEFYRRFNLPIPRRAPFERHHERLRFIADHLELRERICGKCGKTMESVYTEEEFPIVYCDGCYHSHIV